MKLPSDISDYETPFNRAFAEAIVRDCVKVCDNIGLDWFGVSTYDKSDAADYIANAILSRYGLDK